MRIALAAGVVAGLVALTAWFFEMPLEKAVLVAPITVLAFGAAFGLVVLWTKVIVESLRGRREAYSPVDPDADSSSSPRR